MKSKKNENIYSLDKRNLKRINGGFWIWTVMSFGFSVAMRLRAERKFDSGNMSEAEYAQWYEGLTGVRYDG